MPAYRGMNKKPSKQSSVEEIHVWAVQILEMNPTDSEIIVKNKIDGECWSMITLDQCLQIGMSFGSAVKFLKTRTIRQSYDDVQSLLQILMLVAALLLSFSITLLTSSKLEDLKTGDVRYFNLSIMFIIFLNTILRIHFVQNYQA